MATGIVRAACYFRMSDDKQENSIDRQRQNIAPYVARKGYAVSDETTYADEGVPGDEFEKRPGFQRLLAHAAAGKFEVIVCDEVSRLSRQRFTEFMAKVAYPLELAGVTVDTVAEGPLGWEEVADLLKLTIFQTTASGESKKLSYRTLTGQAAVAARGRLLGGPRPFGYTVEYETVTVPGKPPKVVPVRLVPDDFKAEIVKYIFDRYDRGATISEIVDELNSRCPAAGGGRWGKTSVARILGSIVYTGVLAWNKSARGKYHSLRGGRAVKGQGQRRQRRERNDPGDWVLVEGTHEAIVAPELFGRVQDRLRGNRNGRDRSRRGGYVLSGLLQCGHCGRTLYGFIEGGHIKYGCGRRDATGAVICACRRVRQDAVVGMLTRALRRAFLAPDNLASLRAEIERQLRAERAPKNLAGLRSRIAELTKQIVRGTENLTVLPADMVPGVVEVIRKLEKERAAIEADIGRAERGDRLSDFEATVASAEKALWRLEDAAAKGDPQALRRVIRQMISRVVVRWNESRTATGRTRSHVAGGVIHYLPAGAAEFEDASRSGGRLGLICT
jgi:DNA invertase Pin-like site-specific DNA recombinase